MVYILTIITGIISYLVRIVFAHNLSVYDYGLFYAVYSFIFFFVPFRDLGLTESMLFYVNKFLVKKDYKRVKETVLISLIPQLILGVFFALIFIALSSYLSIHYFKTTAAREVIIILSIFFGFQTLQPTVLNIFNALHKFTIKKIGQFLSMFFILLIAIFLFKTNSSAMVPALSYTLSSVLVILIMSSLAFKQFPFLFKEKTIIERDLTKKIFNYAIPILFSTGGILILAYSDVLLLTFFKGVESVGYYNIALPCLTALLLAITPLSDILFPIISRYYHSKNNKKISSLLGLIYNNILTLTMPLAFMFFAFAKQIIIILFGSKYVPATNALRIFSLFFIFMALRTINFSIIAGVGKPKERSIILYYGAGFNIIADLLLIPKFGISGAAFATGLGYALMAYLTFRLINKFYKAKINLFLQLKVTSASLLFLGLIYLLKGLIYLPALLKSGIILLISSLFYITLLFAFNIINKDKIKYLKSLMLNNL